MGNLIRLLFQGLKYAAPAALGYFFNDASRAVSGLLPANWKVTNDDGTPKWWFVLLIFTLGGVVIFFLLRMLAGKKSKSFLLLALGLAFCYSVSGSTGFSLSLGFVSVGLVIATLTTGAAAVTTAYTTYVPRFFWYTAATQLTGIQISSQGDGVIFDSDANGLTHCGVSRIIGQPTNTFMFILANGLITNKNVTWTFTNSAAQTPTINVDSNFTAKQNERLYLQLIRQVALGPGGTDFSDFATLSFPSMAATDYCNINYADGTQQSNILRGDLQAFISRTQNVVNTPIYQLDNFDRSISKVNFQAAATQTAYLQRWIAPISDGMINQAPIAKG